MSVHWILLVYVLSGSQNEFKHSINLLGCNIDALPGMVAFMSDIFVLQVTESVWSNHRWTSGRGEVPLKLGHLWQQNRAPTMIWPYIVSNYFLLHTLVLHFAQIMCFKLFNNKSECFLNFVKTYKWTFIGWGFLLCHDSYHELNRLTYLYS